MDKTVIVIVILIVAALAALFLRKRKPSAVVNNDQVGHGQVGHGQVEHGQVEQRNNQPDAMRTSSAPDIDQQVLDQLRAAGSDLSKPHEMEFLLYFPTEELAGKVAGKIRAEGFRVEVKRAAQGSSWLCHAAKRMVPNRAEIAAIGKRFSALARESGGEYDGWETEVVH